MALKLNAEVALNAVGFERGITRLAGTARNMLLAAFGSISFANLTRGAFEWASKLRDSADALGVNVEFLQKLQNGAKLAGADIEEITKLILELNRSRQAALQNPAGPEAKALGRFGFSSKDISGLSTKDFTQQLIGKFGGGVTTQMANDLQAIGGRSAKTLLAAFVNQFQSATPIASEKAINSLDRAGDELEMLKQRLLVDFVPALKLVADAVHAKVAQIRIALAALEGFSSKLTFKNFFRGGKLDVEGGLERARKAAVKAGNEEHAQLVREAEDRKRELALRHARENAPPGFEPGEPKPTTVKAVKEAIPDSLVSVGNFLGSNANSLPSIAQQHLEVSQKHLQVSQAQLALAQQAATQVGLSLAFPM